MSDLKDSTSVVISIFPTLSISSVEAQRASPASFSVGSSSSMDFINSTNLSPCSSPAQSPIGSELSSNTLFPFSIENMMFGGANLGNLLTTKTDDDDFIIDEEEELIIDDGDLDDCAWSPDAYWFTEEGGLTGDAINFLHTLDSQGELV